MYEFQVSACSEEKIQCFFQDVQALDTSIEDWTGVYIDPNHNGEIFGFGCTSFDLEVAKNFQNKNNVTIVYFFEKDHSDF